MSTSYSRSDQVARLLALLSTTQREVLRLRLVAHLSVEETAAVLGSTPDAVTTAQARALQVLQEQLISRRAPETPVGSSGPRVRNAE
ncbi:sigma factor-like helix-turn-helix DNA-binding protein [Actinocrispum wychmicini]|uniref:Sigma-70-like protein n=1 Tax=Actinocrispum wychmicini TaxID=1213861 RepID=A0A4R2IVY4_9PSEU|nr:sigma factor-like helix-turn-helix DNA-binding protein [Actinocrispum wychmicini]TCO48982.1 sigma-70-like protein [Actinocrispum wychmicini]